MTLSTRQYSSERECLKEAFNQCLMAELEICLSVFFWKLGT